jgi:hypothetical protein
MVEGYGPGRPVDSTDHRDPEVMDWGFDFTVETDDEIPHLDLLGRTPLIDRRVDQRAEFDQVVRDHASVTVGIPLALSGLNMRFDALSHPVRPLSVP